MRASLRLQLSFLFVALVLLNIGAAEQRISRAELPLLVQKTADAQASSATVRGYSKDTEDGKLEYEVEMTVNGHSKDITIAPDGTIWTVGWDKEAGRRVYNVLKRFSPSGTLLSSRHVTVKPFPGDPTDDVSNLSYLHSSGDRVAWLTAAGEYLEFSFDGNEIARFEAPAYHLDQKNGFVLRTWFYLGLSDRNEVVVASLGTSTGSSLWRLNRDAHHWTPVNVSGEQINSRLLGFDGDELIVDYQTANRGEMVGRFSYSLGN